jgi:hypothetical protein
MALLIPSPPSAGIHLGPAYIHAYGLMYVIGISLAIWITAPGQPTITAPPAQAIRPAQRRDRASGGTGP